jgi:hypothetical protein
MFGGNRSSKCDDEPGVQAERGRADTQPEGVPFGHRRPQKGRGLMLRRGRLNSSRIWVLARAWLSAWPTPLRKPAKRVRTFVNGHRNTARPLRA